MNEAATSLEVRMACGLRLQSRAAMRLAISRLIEERVAEVVGIQDVRRWLLVIGGASEGRSCIAHAQRNACMVSTCVSGVAYVLCAARDGEEDSIDVGTVAGYRRVVMCQEVGSACRMSRACTTTIHDGLRLLACMWH
jgi:hypothetical protein